jgi:Iron-containing redox enzyme
LNRPELAQLSPSRSARLRLKLDLALPYLAGSNRAFIERKDFAERFRIFLVIVHSTIRASVPLLNAAASESEKYDNDLSRRLAKYYRDHAIEEMHHDEWLLEDLGVLGVPKDQVLSAFPPIAAAELVGAQYYWIHHLHPACLLGYILVVEGYPMTKEGVEELIARTGFPRDAFRTLFEHSSLDVHHLEELNETIDELPLSTQHERWIGLNSIFTVRKLTEIMNSI